MRSSIAAVAFAIFLASCSHSNDPGNTVTMSQLAGTWAYSSAQCNGSAITISSYSETLTINSNGQATDTMTVGSCTATNSNLTLVLTGGNQLGQTGGTVSCNPNPCTLTISETYQGTTYTSSYTCPTSMPTGSSTPDSVSINGNIMSLSSSSGGMTCVTNYTKQ